jgi:hypothetical protein
MHRVLMGYAQSSFNACTVSLRLFSCLLPVEKVLASSSLTVLAVLDLDPGRRVRRVLALACSLRSPPSFGRRSREEVRATRDVLDV